MPFCDRSIDLAVLTHPHADHLTGLLEVLRRYNVGQVLYPPSEGNSPLYDEWVRFIGEAGTKSTVARTGQQLDLGDGVIIEVIWPRATPLTGTDDDVHNNCVVLLLKVGKVNFLLTGDSTSTAEWELIRSRADIKGTILKVAHHGSKTATTPQFLAVVDPQAAVISVGAGNSYNLPNQAIVERLGEKIGQEYVYETDKNGTITFITDGERLWVESE
jgi:competence protein ComEC